ncbi:PAM68 family protein [Leptolyngbya sp. PCC 6406]|uniref:PAM68 family protein n=1 Tax=Leptolyngbya sp. PCC 6406 TaxID=1173264 RepID=UPI0002ABCA8D|nr:PAM68 family protein [Leptolyngbya sp. PCC 6406]
MAAESERDPLPFEPSRKRKKTENKAPLASTKASPKADKSQPHDHKSNRDRADAGIPEVVSQRMLRRMLAFSGIPTGLGIATFFISYVLVVRHIVDLPNVAVLLVTLGCFGLGVIGLSYGALSASWEETRPGNLLGLGEFRANFGRLTGSWREAREARRTGSDS